MATDKVTLLKNLRSEGCDYEAILHSLNEEKRTAQTDGDKPCANYLWALEQLVEIHKQFVGMYTLLRLAKYYEAWCVAAKVEISLHFLSSNSTEVFETVKDLGAMVGQLQSLYPYRVFASYVMEIKKEACTICGRERSIKHFCGHRVGRVYNGDLCLNEVKEASFKGVDIVENPVNKYSVLFPSVDGKQKDHYDYTLIAGLMNYWSRPFQHWSYEIKNIFKCPDEFPDLHDDDSCPCGSAQTYAECCKGNIKGIRHRIYRFVMETL